MDGLWTRAKSAVGARDRVNNRLIQGATHDELMDKAFLRRGHALRRANGPATGRIMCPRDDHATHPDVDTCEPRDESPVPMMALIILWSAAEPHRAGEIAFLHGSSWWFIGRGDERVEEFLDFKHQRPCEPTDESRCSACLQGRTMSARQLAVRATAVAIEMNQIGTCLTLVNGKEQRTAKLKPGDTVLIRGVALLLCVRRPRRLPALGTSATLTELHSFGEPDRAGIVGEGPAAWELRKDLASAAAGPYHVLLTGGSGSGKEMSGAAIHTQSARSDGPYVTSSAAVFTGTLVESKLFGNVHGYPNPGTPARKGLFATADRGTLFLDEIADCPADIQPVFLRVMDEGEFTPQGESVARHTDVRIVGATNRDPSRLRHEILMRFKKRVRVPALSERREDIPLLIRHLALKRARVEPERMKPFLYTGPSGRTEVRMSGRVVDYLARHPLEGNVRELEILLNGFIDKSKGDQVRLPSPEETESVRPVTGKPSEDEVREALKSADENVRKAAEKLGMKSTSLYRLMKDYGIERGTVKRSA